MMSHPVFRVGITRDFLTSDGRLLFGRAGLALDTLEAAGFVEYSFLPEDGPEVRPEWVANLDAVISLGVRWSAASFAVNQRLALIARWGVGYDMIDLDAATTAGVAVTISPDAVRRPVAVAEVTLLLALTQRVVLKDDLVRRGEWADKAAYPGLGLTGRTLGSLGVGNIGAELFRLMRPFDMRCLAHDPFADPERAAALGVTLVDFDTLLRESDVLCINCPLLPETRGIIDARALSLMRPTAYLINTARGPIVDQAALTAALQRGHPLTTLDNVLLAPHALAWTDELYRANAESDARAILAVARGEEPAAIVNQAVLHSIAWRARLAAFRAAFGGR
jgi:phosphoglycerate dehydrogenase-like enzyme